MGGRPAGDEIGELRKRLEKLEARTFRERQRANRVRAASLGLAVGAAVLVLALALPWLRDSGPAGLRVLAEGEVLLDARGSATGWEMWGTVFITQRWGLLLGFVAQAVAFLTAVWAVFVLGGDRDEAGNGILLAVQVAAAVPPVVFLLSFWTFTSRSGGPEAGPGVFAAVAACILILISAQRGKDL